MENRHGLVVNTRLTQATGTTERETALAMVRTRGERNGSPWAAQGLRHDTLAFVQDLRAQQVTPTWPSIRPGDGVRLMGAPHTIPVTP